MANQAEMVPEILQTWLGWWRDLAMITWGNIGSNGSIQITNIDHLSWLQQMAEKYSGLDTTESLKQTEKSMWALAHNANARLVLENLFLKYPPAPHAAEFLG